MKRAFYNEWDIEHLFKRLPTGTEDHFLRMHPQHAANLRDALDPLWNALSATYMTLHHIAQQPPVDWLTLPRDAWGSIIAYLSREVCCSLALVSRKLAQYVAHFHPFPSELTISASSSTKYLCNPSAIVRAWPSVNAIHYFGAGCAYGSNTALRELPRLMTSLTRLFPNLRTFDLYSKAPSEYKFLDRTILSSQITLFLHISDTTCLKNKRAIFTPVDRNVLRFDGLRLKTAQQ